MGCVSRERSAAPMRSSTKITKSAAVIDAKIDNREVWNKLAGDLHRC
jgi:hypothetical protein